MQDKAEIAKFSNPIIPAVHAPMRTLIIALSIMCYLASMSIGGLLLINRAVSTWTSDISREISVQVLPRQGSDIDTDLAAVSTILEATEGISAIKVFSYREAKSLLEPWIGTSRILDELPVPRLIGVTIDKNAPPNLTRLTQQLDSLDATAQLDTHLRWQSELSATAQALQGLGLMVLIIIAGAAIALVIYAARTALEANKDVIEVLYLVGAADRFIARRIENRFLFAGLRAGTLGMMGGLGSFIIIALAGVAGYSSGMSETSASLLGLRPGNDNLINTYATFLLIPVIATLITLITTRIAATRILRMMS